MLWMSGLVVGARGRSLMFDMYLILGPAVELALSVMLKHLVNHLGEERKVQFSSARWVYTWAYTCETRSTSPLIN